MHICVCVVDMNFHRQVVCNHLSERWLSSIKNKSKKPVQTEYESSYGNFFKIYLTKGEVRVSSPRVSQQFFAAGYTQSANIHLISTSIDAIDTILSEEGHPCWKF